jgi:hypothetical protein
MGRRGKERESELTTTGERHTTFRVEFVFSRSRLALAANPACQPRKNMIILTRASNTRDVALLLRALGLTFAFTSCFVATKSCGFRRVFQALSSGQLDPEILVPVSHPVLVGKKKKKLSLRQVAPFWHFSSASSTPFLIHVDGPTFNLSELPPRWLRVKLEFVEYQNRALSFVSGI